MTDDTELQAEALRVFEALARRLIALGSDETTVRKKAVSMVRGWDYFSSNSVDERGRETCRDWMDEEVVRLLDEALSIHDARIAIAARDVDSLGRAERAEAESLGITVEELRRREHAKAAKFMADDPVELGCDRDGIPL
jgi:hypothetical protein